MVIPDTAKSRAKSARRLAGDETCDMGKMGFIKGREIVIIEKNGICFAVSMFSYLTPQVCMCVAKLNTV
jgi:hypothetical protein